MLKLLKYSILNILLTSVFTILFITVFLLLSFMDLFDETLLIDYVNISVCAPLFFSGFFIARKKVFWVTWKKYLCLGFCIFIGIALPYFGMFVISRSWLIFKDWIYFVFYVIGGIFGFFVCDKLLPKQKHLAYGMILLFFTLFFLPFLSLDLETYYGNRLMKAVKADNFEEVKKTVASENVHYVDETGATPIMWAAYNGNEKIVDFLVKNGADIKKAGFITIDNNSDFTIFTSPLEAAAAKGRLGTVKYLIEEAGIKPDENHGCLNNLLLEEKDIENFDKIKDVIRNVKYKYIKELRNFDFFTKRDYSKSQQEASFLYAMYLMTVKFDLVNEKYDKFLLRRIANNRKKIDEIFEGGIRKAESYEFFIGGNGETPLITAVKEGHARVVSYLISKGADVNYKDCNGNTPLSVAKEEKRPELIEMLIKNDAVE